MCGSGIKALDGIAGKLDENSQSTFSDINSEFSNHSRALEDLFREIASEADAILNDLQSGLHNQEEKLTAISQQQCEAHSRAMENARSISKIAVNFFKTLDMHASNLTQVVEEAQTLKDQKLSEFEKKFEECAANEERRLVEKVAELLVSSNARKKQVQMAVHDLQESACSKTNQLLKEMSTMQDSTCAVKAEWKLHMEKTESLNLADISAVERGKTDLKGGFLQNCLKKGSVSAQQWQKAQESLLNLEKSNVASVDSIVRCESCKQHLLASMHRQCLFAYTWISRVLAGWLHHELFINRSNSWRSITA